MLFDDILTAKLLPKYKIFIDNHYYLFYNSKLNFHNGYVMRILQKTVLAVMLGTLCLTGCQKPADKAEPAPVTEANPSTDTTSQALTAEQQLVNSYADMAQASYQDSLDTAKALQSAINTFVANPTETNLQLAKDAYKTARKPYSQTEVFRFDEGFVGQNDKRSIPSVDDWEGQVNAWPLDEALIDYVNDDYEGDYDDKNNIINSSVITIGSDSVDVSTLSTDVLASLNEIGGSEANVATGYHAIEFLLWGQDTNGTGEGAGNRPVSDYDTTHCTSGNAPSDSAICQKRGEYLKLAVQLLVNDLNDMVAEWQKDSPDTLRSDLLASTDDNAIRQILYQMGSLSLGELASERMQVAFVTGSTEDEHDCFSDLTHNSYAHNAQGIKNLFTGDYQTQAGTTVGGYGLKQYLIDKGQPEQAAILETHFNDITAAFDAIVTEAEEKGIKVDQMIATVGQAAKHGVDETEQHRRRTLIQTAIERLQTVTESLEKAAASIGIDNLDADGGSMF